jgi:beta-lactamase class A
MMWMTRRAAIATGVAAMAVPAFGAAAPDWAAELEKKHGGRLGVAVLDTGSGKTYAHRADERFLMCSVFKMLAAAAILKRVDDGKERLDRAIVYGQADMIDYSPVTLPNLAKGSMTLEALCSAAVNESDNTAANLILAQMGGPAGLTAYMRSIGDTVTRLDRMEPDLNIAKGDMDTTSPNAMLRNLRVFLQSDALSQKSQRLLRSWMRASRTGDTRIKAGVPASWGRLGKTGSGDSCNDVVALWPSEWGPPLFVAAFYTKPDTSCSKDTTLMEVGRAVAANFG